MSLAAFETSLGEFQGLVASVSGSAPYQIVAPGAPAYTQPPAGVTSAAWNAVLDAVRQLEGNANYGYGCPAHCCDPSTEDCRALASRALTDWYNKFGNLIQALNYYNTGDPNQGYGKQGANTAQVLFAGASGIGDELSRAGITINPGGPGAQSRAATVGQGVGDVASAISNFGSNIKWTTVLVAIVGVILIGIAANQLSKG